MSKFPLSSRKVAMCLSFAAAMLWAPGSSFAQLAVSPAGQPTYSVPIAVAPGIAGMTPQLSLHYAGAGVNGPQGHGWSLQGISLITRCASTLQLDGVSRGVAFDTADRLCLDGQRLIRTNAAGVVQASSNDGSGLAGGYVEYRTEKDTYSRIRAYGSTGNTADGPKYFKVWTKAGQIYEYGESGTNDTRKARIPAQGKTATMVWAVSRISDTVGNYMDFYYAYDTEAWGSGPTAGSPTPGLEWNIAEIRYTGSTATGRVPYNKVVFDYSDKSKGVVDSLPIDSAEAYQAGSKNITTQRMFRIRSFVGATESQPVLVRSMLLSYEHGGTEGVTGRGRLSSIRECFGESTSSPGTPSTRCQQATQFTYANTGDERIQLSTAFNMSTLRIIDESGEYGILTGDFNGDGRTDFIRWTSRNSDDTAATATRLFTSDGDGSFTEQTAFNFTDRMFTADGCFFSIVMDMNGDGLPDIVRMGGAKKLNGDACTITDGSTHIFRNNGNNTFSPVKITTDGTTAILLDRVVSRSTSVNTCNPVPNNLTQKSVRPTAIGECHDGWTFGANFYIADVNGDGRPDIIKTTLPTRPASQIGEVVNPVCQSQCTFVYLATSQLGKFTLTPSNIQNQTLYSDPGAVGELNWTRHVSDIDGDGLADIVAVGKGDTLGNPDSLFGSWRSVGSSVSPLPSTIQFAYVASGGSACENPIDFNGDGRRDCLYPSTSAGNSLAVSSGTSFSTVAGFNIHTAGLKSADSAGVGSSFGSIIADFNSDGRQDILRWHDTASSNLLYLSNGDGTFRAVTDGYNTTSFKRSDGQYDSVIADFTGKGVGEILRLSKTAVGATDYANKNNLYTRVAPELPDRLLTVTSPTGLVTTLSWATTANASSGRYIPDRGTANAASYPDIDLGAAMPIVTDVVAETGVGAGTRATQYAYLGLKADAKGRGLLGFRETRVQSPAPDGTAMTIATEYLQDRPYDGLANWTETRLASFSGYAAAQTLSKVTNIYCDTTSTTAPGSAAVGAPCATTAAVTRPYLYQSKETGFDLDAARTALPTVTTTNTFDGEGNSTQVEVVTTGAIAGSNRTYTKTTDNVYSSAVTSGDYWVLGRLMRSTVSSSVPNLGLTPSYGTAPYANALSGAGVTQAGSPVGKAPGAKKLPNQKAQQRAAEGAVSGAPAQQGAQ